MKTVTDDFLVAQRSPANVGVRKVYYKRRYWDNTTKEYIWESSWTELEQDEVVSVASINWALDNNQLTEFKVSNVSIVVDNSDNKWMTKNSNGIFKADSASKLHGYEPYWMKFQIRAGFILADESEEVVTMFTGVATEYIYDSATKTCEVQVQGLEATLLNTKADVIATEVTNESKGPGNGVTVAYTTTNPGVGGVRQVHVNGIKKIEGNDFTVSNLNVKATGAIVTFTVAPTVGHSIWVSYYYWPQGLEFHGIVEDLVEGAGVTSHSIDPVVFVNSILNSQLFTQQTDWNTGTKSATETILSPGDLKPDYGDSSFKTATTWSTSLTGWSGNSTGFDAWTTNGTYLQAALVTNFGAVPFSYFSNPLSRSSQRNKGVWEFKYQFTSLPASGIAALSFQFNSSCPSVSVTTGSTGNGVITIGSLAFLISGPAITTGGSQHTVKIVRDGNGTFRVYWDGTLMITSSASTSSAASSTVGVSAAGDVPFTVRVQSISIPTETVQGTWTSADIDWGSTPVAWGTFDHNEDVDSPESIVYQTRTSADGISWDAYFDITAQNLPASTVRRHTMVKILFNVDTTSLTDPVVQDFIVRSTSTGITVDLPAFTGDSVYEALQKIGEFTAYEFGFNPDESFFFRSRTSGDSIMDLSHDDFISRASGLSSGYENVYGTVRATYGTITQEVTDDGQFFSSPKAKVASKTFDISPDESIKIATTADIATGVASSLFAQLSKPRRRLRLTTKFLPQLDIADAITIDLENNQPEKIWFVGDDTVYLGQEDIHLWSDEQQILDSMRAKIIGARYDLTRWSCEFELEEILL